MAHPVPAGWTPEAALASLKRAGPARKNVRRIARNKTEINRHLGDMNRNMKFSNMVMYSISCFKGFAVDAVSIEEMIEEGVIETFLRIQKLNPFNENLHRAINECLTAFCINDDIARMIAERLGGGEQIIHSLLKHTEPETVAASCSAMAKLMRIDPNVDMFVAAECTPALGSVSQRMREEPGVMAAVAECVRAITRNAGHIDAIMRTPIVSELLTALSQFPEDKALVEHVLGALANIAAAHGGKYVDYLRSLGAVDIIAAALDAHPNHAAILKCAAAALTLIAKPSDLTDALAMRIGITDELAQALARLSSLMLVDENAEFMIQKEGLKWLINVLNTVAQAPGSETAYKIARSGARALLRLCKDDGKVYEVLAAGGVQALMALAAAHGGDPETLYAVLKALAKLLTREANAVYLLDSSLMELLLTSLSVNAGARDIAEAVSDNYERLTRYTGVHARIIAAGIVPSILDLLKTHSEDREIVEYVLVHLLYTRFIDSCRFLSVFCRYVSESPHMLNSHFFASNSSYFSPPIADC